MKFLLDLPIWAGILIVISIFACSGLFVVIQVKKRLQHKINKKHEKVGRILFRVTAGLIALLLSLSYANERMQQYKLIDSMEMEVSSLVNISINLRLLDSPESELLRKELISYINSTIDEDWKNIQANPFFSPTSKKLLSSKKMAYEIPVRNENESLIKQDIIDNLNRAIEFMQIRIYSQHALTPSLIYILCIGLIFMWIFFTVYNLDFIALSFLSLYNIFVAILIYLIFMMSNPLIGALKIEPHPFNIVKSKGIDYKFK